eukprot:1211870-Prymnesium_polylepis.1
MAGGEHVEAARVHHQPVQGLQGHLHPGRPRRYSTPHCTHAAYHVAPSASGLWAATPPWAPTDRGPRPCAADVFVVLEETQVLVQTILGSRFVGPMQKKVDEWEKKLRLFSETVDEWLAVQRSWMYLESIFKAADIQRQLPNEYKDFDKINK